MNFPSRMAAAALSIALAAASLFAPPALAEDPQLPPGVVARVYGEDVTEAQLFDRLARRHETTDKGKQILEQIVDDQVVALESRRRGVSVTDDEARAYADKMAEVVKQQSGGHKTLDDMLAESKTSRDEFLRTAKEYLVREKMARADLGTKPEEDLPEHRMKLWISSLRRRMNVRYAGLPEGVLASIGGAGNAGAGAPAGDTVTIDRARFAKELATRLPPELVAGVRAELIIDTATRHAVERAGVTVTDADLDEQIARLRKRFENNPRVKDTGVTFDQFLRQTFGIGEADLRKDPTFRSRVGLERMLGRDLDDAKVRKNWDENRSAYGERALLRQVFVAAGEDGGKFSSRMPTFREASDLALRAKVAILERAGLLKGAADTGTPARMSLGDVVTAVAKEFEGDPERRQQAGEPVAWTRQNVASEASLEKAVFEGEIGQVVGPVRSNVGYHVLVIEERRPAPSFDEVKTQVREDLLRVAIRNFQLGIRAGPDIIIAK